MANFFKKKNENDTELYNEWDEVDDYSENEYEALSYEEDAEYLEEEEFVGESEDENFQMEESEEYYPEEYQSEETDESEGYISEEEESFSEEEYYEEEEEYYEEEEEYYEEDEYYEDVEAETDEEEDESTGFFSDMSLGDELITFGSAALVLVAVFIAGFFVLNKKEPVAVNEYLAVGSQLSGIDIIGESGLLAVAGQEQNRLQALEDALHAETNPEYNESEYSDEVEVNMTLTSIEKDLKIKFTNKKTGKLVGNVPFSVEITDAGGNTSMWSDDDMDGIIHKKKLSPGQYKVEVMALDGEKYDKYDLPQAVSKVEVKSEIVIQKVDVSNEIKNESEIDVSKEDTAQQDTTVEGYLDDTVAWVESTVTKATYTEINKESVEVPKLPTAAMGIFSLRNYLTGNVSGGDVVVPQPTPVPTPEPTPTATPIPTASPSPTPTLTPSPTPIVIQGEILLDKTSVTMSKNRTATVKVVGITTPPQDIKISYAVSSSNAAVATASVDGAGVVTINSIADGEAVITLTANYNNGVADVPMASKEIKVKVADKLIQLHIIEMTVYTTFKEPITVFISNAGVEEDKYNIVAESSNTAVATATVDILKREVTVTGVAAGTAEITVKYIEGEEVVSKVCKVTVLDHPMTDKKTKLVTKDTKEQLYVYEGSKYREATYADYYTASKFYVLGQTKYTGWQTLNGKVYFFTAAGKKVTGEQVIQGVKYNFASDGSLVTGDGIMGIDVSKWNGTIDWKAVKNSGVSYVIIRCGYRGSTKGSLIVDSKFKENIEGAIDAGLKVGVYFFTQAIDNAEALEEASMVLDLVKKYKLSYPIFLDVEPSGGRADSLSKEERTAICKTFCETIEKYGYTAGIYANKTWLTNKIDASALGNYKIWLAQYASTPTYSGRYDMWQYKDTGKVSGIDGNVDLNMSYLGY